MVYSLGSFFLKALRSLTIGSRDSFLPRNAALILFIMVLRPAAPGMRDSDSVDKMLTG